MCWWSVLILTVQKKSEKLFLKDIFYAILLISLNLALINSTRDYSISFDYFESVPGTTRTLLNRSLRFERNAAHENSIVGSFVYLEDFGNDVVISGSFATSSLGNSKFILSRMRIPPTPFCDYINTTWREFIQPSLENCSTFPVLPAEGLCPYPKGNYELNCSRLILTDKVPSHLPQGLWRLNLTFTKNGEFIGGNNNYFTVDAL